MLLANTQMALCFATMAEHLQRMAMPATSNMQASTVKPSRAHLQSPVRWSLPTPITRLHKWRTRPRLCLQPSDTFIQAAPALNFRSKKSLELTNLIRVTFTRPLLQRIFFGLNSETHLAWYVYRPGTIKLAAGNVNHAIDASSGSFWCRDMNRGITAAITEQY